MCGRETLLMVAGYLCGMALLFTDGGINAAIAADAQNESADAKKQPAAKISVDAGIVPQPGEPMGIAVKFDVPMDRSSSPTATLAIGKAQPQRFSKGRWDAEGTSWTFASTKLGSATGLGQLIVEGASNSDGRWMIDHRHEFIFVEGYDYRTLLALYEITGKQVYLHAARKGADNLLGKQQPYGHWGTGYGSIYLADTGSALGLFINLYQFATPQQRKKIDAAFELYCEMVLVKGDGTGKPFIHKEGWVGIGFRSIKDGKVVGPINNPYTIATSLSGPAHRLAVANAKLRR